MKTLSVAIFSFSTRQTELPPWLCAAIAATAGVILLQKSPPQLSKTWRLAALYAAGASILFASCDIHVVEAHGQLGIGWLSPTLFVTVALLVSLLGQQRKPPEEAQKPLYLGAATWAFKLR